MWKAGGAIPRPGSKNWSTWSAPSRPPADGGREAFYGGEIGEAIAAYFRRIGGWMTLEDLRDHRGEWTRPLSVAYRGVEVWGLGPNTQGVTTLQMLNMLEQFDL